jgi:hypothetical protein
MRSSAHEAHGRGTIFVTIGGPKVLHGVVTSGAEGSPRGATIEPALRETYENGVRKATHRDPDGNEIGFGGAPLAGTTE